MAGLRLTALGESSAEQVKTWRQEQPDIADGLEDVLVLGGGGDDLVDLDINRSSARVSPSSPCSR